MSYKRISPMPVNEGGTGNTTLTVNTVLVGNGTTAISQVTAGTTGQALMGATGSNPAFTGSPSFSGSVTAATTITATSGAVTATAGNVVITAGNLTLPNTNSAGTNGVITFGGTSFIKNYGTNNTFIGPSAGNTSLTTASATTNTAVGSSSLGVLTTGNGNVAVGSSSAASLTSGTDNCFVGISAGLLAVSGSSNVAIGPIALGSCASGSTNIAIGSFAGNSYTTTESNNIAIGTTGTIGDSGVIRIGTNGTQTSCFIQGIDGVNVGSVAKVVTEASNQLGTATITAGTGITITPTANTITIASSISGGITTAAGDSGTATGSTVTWNANTNSGITTKFTASSATVSLNVTDANNNTIIGSGAGGSAIYDNNSTAVGYKVLNSTNSSSSGSNTAFGSQVLQACTTGGSNCAIGNANLVTLTTGNYNCAIGSAAGFSYTGSESNNVLIQNLGTVGESNTLRISSSGTGNRQVSKAYIGGITGVVVTGTPVLVSSGDQLGVAASSKRFKNDIRDMGSQSADIFKLRPVTFFWDKNSSPGLKDAFNWRQFGLIAEEVAEIMPELVHWTDDGQPFSVKYNDIPAMLLNELKKALKRIDALEATLKTK
jgi:hypothetical protein